VASIVGFRGQHGVFVSIFLGVLILNLENVALVLVLVILLVHCSRWVRTNILAQGLFNDSISAEFFSRSHEHFTHGPTVFYKLEKGVVLEQNSSFSLVVEDFKARQTTIFYLLEHLVCLLVNCVNLLSTEVLERTIFVCLSSLNEIQFVVSF
jgi:hypothetical protein